MNSKVFSKRPADDSGQGVTRDENEIKEKRQVHSNNPTTALRRAASARLKARPAGRPPPTEAGLRRLQHELEVHQIERETQNEELRAAQAKAAARLERYIDLYEFAPVGYFNLAADGTIRLVNLTGARLVGVERTLLLKQRFGPLLAETDRRAFADFLARIFATPEKRTCELALGTQIRPPRIVHLEAALAADGRECRVVMLDITERRAAEAQLKASLAQVGELKLALDKHAIVAITDLQGKITFANDKFCAISKYSRQELLGQDHRLINSGNHSKEFMRDLWATIGRGEVWQGEIKNRAKDGSFYWVATTIVPSLDERGQPRHYIAVRADITERKQAEEELRNSREQLRALSGRLETLREEERTRISREIHDELGQMLTGIKMDLRWMEHHLDVFGKDRRVNPILDKLVITAELTDATIKTVQRIAAELRPGILDKLGLGTALQYETAQFGERTGIAGRVMLPAEEPPLSPPMATAFFRIFQEALTNVARHAHATEVAVEFCSDGDGCRLEIRDNGRGLVGVQLTNPKSLGLLGMQERARLLGGEVNFGPRAGGGTVVSVLIPNQPSTKESI